MGRGRRNNKRGPRTDPATSTTPAEGSGAPGRTDLIAKGDMKNERFERYYKTQGLFTREALGLREGAEEGVEGEKEFEEMLEAFRRHLPTTFRIAGSRQTVHSLNKMIADIHVPTLNNVVFEGEKIPPPVRIPWYPEGCAWQFNVPKKVLRRQPEFKKFHSFLVFETEVGNISRQEAVSMIPPLFLDVEPHHKVMDMCAAPGSKTAQILEALHANDTSTSTSIPSGLLIANDSDAKRTHLLIHQSARLPSPALMVTNLDASNYPLIRVPSSVVRDPSSSSSASLPAPGGKEKMETLLFDRILCDVPCSGDGTMRKNIGIWKSWQPTDGNGLHALQVRILQRGMRMLAPAGRIVYSTCSLNPVENEAVIAAALKSNPDFELVDVSSQIPELKRLPGLKKWIPSVDRMATQFFETYDEMMASNTDKQTKSKLVKTQWPPADIKSLNIERCMRIYPHHQDTGGFFVAVLERKKKDSKKDASTSQRKRQNTEVEVESEEVPESKRARIEGDETVDSPTPESAELESPIEAEETETVEAAMDTTEDGAPSSAPSPSSTKPVTEKKPQQQNSGHNGKKADKDNTFKENPYNYVPPNHPLLQSCLEKLNIISSFPSHHVLVRNPVPPIPSPDSAASTGAAPSTADNPIRSFYLSNALVKAVITHNDFQKLRLTAAGTKVFTKQEAGKGLDAQYRVLGEGLPVVLPFVKKEAILKGRLSVLKVFLESYYPLVKAFDEEFRAQIDESSTGSLIVRFSPEETDKAVLTHDLVLPIWKSTVSLSLMIDKKAKSALSLRLFGEDLMAKVTRTQGDGSGKKKPAAAAADADAQDVEEDMGMEEPDEELPVVVAE